MQNANNFGPAEQITVGELQPGDFVVEIPAQHHIRGHRFQSAVKTTETRWDRYTMSSGYRRPRYNIESRKLTFISVPSAAYHYPADFTCTARRPERGPLAGAGK